MRRHLPSLVYLRAFEATARHGSFTRAALELNVTQTAVSHQIKALEEFLGLKLFIREGGRIRLTPPAHDYLISVRTLLTELSTATQRAVETANQQLLTVACLSTFGMKCLIPNLRDFVDRHPNIPVRVRTVTSFEGLMRHDYDLGVRYGSGSWPGLVAWPLRQEEIFPVCSPTLRGSGLPMKEPADLRHHRLIRTASLILQDEWSTWLEVAGVEELSFASEITFDLLLPSVQAAIDGLGFVMGRSPLVEPDIAAGNLIAPFELRLPSSSGFYLASAPDLADLPKVQLFREWAMERFGDHAQP